MGLYSLYTVLFYLIIVIAIVNGYHLLSIYYAPRTLLGAIQTYSAMRPLLLHFLFKDLGTRNKASMIT